MSKSKSWIADQGSKIAAKCEWDGTLILEVLSAALIDANFHHDASILTQMIHAYDVAELPRFTLTFEDAGSEMRDHGLFSGIDDDEDDDGGDDYTFPDDHPLFGANDPAKLPEDDPRYIPF